MSQSSPFFDVIVIGGGASGLMCAMTAGRRGRSVLVIDASNKVGKKILMSGGGRCNFTNMEVTPEHYICANPHFVKSALTRYSNWDFIGMVLEHGIAYHERKHGQLFCDDSAKDILTMLLQECEQAGVKVTTHCKTTQVRPPGKEGEYYRLSTSQGELRCASLVIATGSLSIPTMGATGFGHDIARQFAINVLPLRAGLVPFTFSDGFKAITERLSGLALDGTLSCGRHSFSEAILFTHRGLSGPAVLQLSNYWQPGDEICLDLLPSLDMGEWLKAQKSRSPKSLVRTLVGQHLAKALVVELQQLFWPAQSETAIAEATDSQLQQIGDHINGWVLKPSGTEGYRTAEVTLGGVDTDQISSKTFEAKGQPGLYFIGEVLDVSGHLGGFNFQWAWSSGFAAGQYV
ncbi:NAD(P)/FAD-dependent oxidoreductase [Sinobacterium caligoides]|uniref:NAD(P)/FAD-dependent oxidoreductase n=1 Tax=Sinobacterium caligoides TaxID=933926 RepID=UPI002482344A|nr:NAD(P)/FAD-dependent oxidoreductase [Sinobacterium caligoides]